MKKLQNEMTVVYTYEKKEEERLNSFIHSFISLRRKFLFFLILINNIVVNNAPSLSLYLIYSIDRYRENIKQWNHFRMKSSWLYLVIWKHMTLSMHSISSNVVMHVLLKNFDRFLAQLILLMLLNLYSIYIIHYYFNQIISKHFISKSWNLNVICWIDFPWMKLIFLNWNHWRLSYEGARN
jgi:hypothetical protein